MSTHLGQEGTIKVNDQTIAQIRSWTLNTAAEMIEASTLKDTWKVHHAAIKSWHGSLSCFWDDGDQGQGILSLGSKVQLTLYPGIESCPHFSGNVLVTGIDYTATHNGLVEANLSFQGTGPLNHTSDVVVNTKASATK